MIPRSILPIILAVLTVVVLSTCVTKAHDAEGVSPVDLDGNCHVIIVPWLDPPRAPLTIIMCHVVEDLNPFSDTDSSMPRETKARTVVPNSGMASTAEPVPAAVGAGRVDDVPPTRSRRPR